MQNDIIDVPFVYCEDYTSRDEAVRLFASLKELGLDKPTAAMRLIMVYLDSAYFEGTINHLMKG